MNSAGNGGVVKTGMIHGLCTVLSRQLGRKVTVHHTRYQFQDAARRLKWSPWRYTLFVEGVDIPFSGMTPVEVKSRLAMLSDLIAAGVFTSDRASPADQADSGQPLDREGQAYAAGDAERAQSPGVDDSY